MVEIPKRRLGKTGADVTILGLGGEGILRTFGHEKDACNLINAAVDAGINYFESARAYSGSEHYYGLALLERRKEVFLCSKSHARDKKGAQSHLRETLQNMRTGHLDLWQIHDIRTSAEVDEIFGRNGALEAFIEARDKGDVRFIGVTGHHDPSVIRRCIEAFDFDTVLMPLNPAEHSYNSFIEGVLPLAQEKGMGIIAMKVYFRGMAARLPGISTLDPFFRFALSHPVTTAVIGCDSMEQLHENTRFASGFTPLREDELHALSEACSYYARKLMYYKP